MVAEPGQRIREGQIRIFLAWLTGAKRRLHHASVLMSVFSARLAAKRLGKVSENRFSVVQTLLASPAVVQLRAKSGNPAQIFVYAYFLIEISNDLFRDAPV
ncbi:hypothetical protein [Mesorhizobium sp. B4-1-1]|uniref:hypothetical protein n=1 Tax=Mesorhizobium sp. B4-1-1 TaxID=2589890 RepID=UPI0015E3F83D|nr:hypothetical protein [Mesorhizobium sp. B4-1-1]